MYEAWDAANRSSLTVAEEIVRNTTKERLQGAGFELLYGAWGTSPVPDRETGDQFQRAAKTHRTHLSAQILYPFGPSEIEAGVA
jgi:hypothetical protein